MPWPTKCSELQDAAVKVLDAFEVLAESLVREVLAHAGLDPDGAVFAHHCRLAARRAGLAATEIDSSPLVNPPALAVEALCAHRAYPSSHFPEYRLT